MGTGDLASFYDLNPIPVEVLHVGGSVGIPGVGIYTSVPNKALTVVGEISATSDITTSGTIYTTSGNSNNWNTAYSVSTAYQNTSGSFAIKGVYLPLSGGQITGFVTSTSSISAANTITSLNLATNNQVQYLSSGVVKVFQYYNTSTNSLDTVFN